MFVRRLFVVLACVALACPAWAQTDFAKTGYYVALGDSFAAGQGANPMTRGYPYLLYELGTFGKPSETFFGNLGLKGTTTWDVMNHQVPMVLCGSERPTVVTITTGGNDSGSLSNRAQRIADAVDMLLSNDVMPDPITYPGTSTPCPAVPNVTILVSNYPRMPGLETALLIFSDLLEAALAGIIVPEGSNVLFVDLFTPSLDRHGLVLGERDPHADPEEDINVHPTNLGHMFIARQFEAAWQTLQEETAPY